MKVELLYFEGCPGHPALASRLEHVLADAGVDAAIEQRAIESDEAARSEGFLGSPTVRVDGVDVEPGAGDRADFGLKCRLYRTPSGHSPLPLEEWLLDALGRSAPRDRGSSLARARRT
ncbi:MAG: DUF2703 domain-containing protein [Actinomycetota bacterium]|nr:DUF2703 domain-containing protein [Actinomycetota bacterium]